MRKAAFVFALVFVFLLSFSRPSFSNSSMLGCSASTESFTEILAESIATLYNIFPIMIAGVPIELVHLPTADDLGGLPICICMTGSPPIPRIGLTFGWWNPQAVIETVKAPFCFPSLGSDVPLQNFLGEGDSSVHSEVGNGKGKPRTTHKTFFFTHYIKYPTILLLNLMTDVTCLNLLENGIDLVYLSEIDPTWRDDTLSDVINPEAILFANPVAQTACIADAATSVAGFPLDPLFWCMGTWGSSYPLAGVKQGDMNLASAGLAARTIYRMTRQFMLWQTVGRGALCQPIPMPIWIKSQYSMFEAYPRLWPMRFPIGFPETIWGVAANPPVPGRDDNYVWFMYQHHQCCLF